MSNQEQLNPPPVDQSHTEQEQTVEAIKELSPEEKVLVDAAIAAREETIKLVDETVRATPDKEIFIDYEYRVDAPTPITISAPAGDIPQPDTPNTNVEESPKDAPVIEETEEDLKEKKHIEDFLKTKIEVTAPFNFKDFKWNPYKITQAINSNIFPILRNRINSIANIDFTKSPELRAWANVLQRSTDSTPEGDMLSPAICREGAEFTQDIDYKGTRLGITEPKNKPSANAVLTGDMARYKLMNFIGAGQTVIVPLWHSGFWVYIKPATDSEIIELHERLMREKIAIGRETYGLIFANGTSYTVNTLIDFVLDHVHITSIKNSDISINQLIEYISAYDLNTLLWGMACAMYPRGYQYERACTAKPGECLEISRGLLNLSKCLYVDKNAFTPWQLDHMLDRTANNKTKESIIRYREEFSKMNSEKITLTSEVGSEVKLTIKAPTILDNISSGQTWIGNIVQNVESIISSDVDLKEKNKMCNTYARMSFMRQYEHFVQSIEFADNIVEDRETIQNNLSDLSSDTTLANEFFEKIGDYIVKGTIAVVGIPTYDCPKCSGVNEDVQYPRFENIIPLEVLGRFFDLIIQRYVRIEDR